MSIPYKRVLAKDIKVGDLCLGTDRSTIYKVKSTSVRQDIEVELYSSPINSTNPFEAYINIFDPHEIVHVVEEEPMTTSVEDIQKEIAKAQETLNQLQKKLDEEKNKKWEPKGGRYYVSISGKAEAAASARSCKGFGNEFETKEAADKASIAYRRYHRLYKLAEELNGGWEPNWTERSNKFYIYYDHYTQNYEYSNDSRHSRIDSVYFKDEHVVEKAIKIIRNGGLD